MKLVISPAKTLDYETAPITKKHTKPLFPKETAELVKKMAKYSEKDIAKLMDISPKLAKLNFDRFQEWPTAPQKQAILAFMGDVYEGLSVSDFTEKDIEFAQDHLRILSGIYGLLRPLDMIKPYRLEMGTKIGLYEFWGDKLTKELGDDVVINLASEEYFKAIKPKKVINVTFYEMKNGKPKIIALFAKKARGMMARYIIKHKVTKPEGMKKFTDGGYKYSEKHSDAGNFVFIR